MEETVKHQPRRRRAKAKKKSALPAFVITTVLVLTVTIAFSFFFSFVRVSASDTMNGLSNGDVVLAQKSQTLESGDIVAFYYENKILLRRCIASQGDWVDITEDGVVTVNGEVVTETYASNVDTDNGDITYPYQVPANRYFVLADNRAILSDSRSTMVGCISEQQMVGKVIFRFWPLTDGQRFLEK